MRAIFPAAILALALATSSGCLAAMPPDENPVHMQIKWRSSFPEAQKEALAVQKPILLVTAAGDITGFC